MQNSQSTRLLAATLLLGITLVAGGLCAKIAFFAYQPARTGADAQAKKVIELRKGDSPAEVTKNLYQLGVIADKSDFLLLGRVLREWKKIKAGEYEVSADMNPLDVFKVITSGQSMAHRITVREGENMYEVAKAIEAEKLATADRILQLCKDPKFIQTLGIPTPASGTLEGYLFPDTYFFNKTMTAEDMVHQMVKKFQSIWTAQHEEGAKKLGLTPYQALTLASVVEKETGAPQERPMVASVFHNRLKKGMKLQSDPTIIYGIWERYQGNLHKADITHPTPYNTYTIPSLPLGPISNPGKEAIDAVLHPADTPYIFFVSHNDGTHEFTTTLKDHTQAVKKFQIDPKAREGKSWRDLKRKSPNSHL